MSPLSCAFSVKGLASSPRGSQAVDCTLVTTGSKLPKKVKDWLEMSQDQHRPIKKGNLRRRGVYSTRPLDCLLNHERWLSHLEFCLRSKGFYTGRRHYKT